MIAAYNKPLEHLEKQDAMLVYQSASARLADAYEKLQHYAFVLKKT